MDTETGREIVKELARVHASVNACFYCLVILVFLAAGTAYRVFGGPFG